MQREYLPCRTTSKREPTHSCALENMLGAVVYTDQDLNIRLL